VAKIFVSYRHDDASSEAGRITDWLNRRFGEDEVFMDINALEPGVDFVDGIEQAVETIDALIAVIGPGWVDAVDEHGNRRLDDPADWVRLEIANALQRGIRVIPVLVKGAAMPSAVKLPDDLQPLRRRNALPITERQWRAGVEELIEALDDVVTPAPPPPPPTMATQVEQPMPLTAPVAKAVEKTYEASTARLYAALLRAVSALGYSIGHSDATDRTVSFNTGLSVWSSGQKMTATIVALDADDSKIVIGGRSRNSLAVFDWGERGRITGKLLGAIDRALPETPEPDQPSAPTGQAPSGSTAYELKRLGELRAQGVLTDEEFTTAKAKLLFGS
jgi:hypothetical protein